MKKKMEMLINKRLEKGHEQIRARTPQTAIKLKYQDVLQSPILIDYLKSQHFFKDEMEEDGDEYMGDLKYVNDLHSPLQWDSDTIVFDVFRVLQDLTPYTFNNSNNQTQIGKFKDFLQVAQPLANNEVVRKIDGNKLGTLSGQGGKDLYSTQTLYDLILNKNLKEAPTMDIPMQGKAVMTFRVKLKQTMSTAILKVPSGAFFQNDVYLSQMQ